MPLLARFLLLSIVSCNTLSKAVTLQMFVERVYEYVSVLFLRIDFFLKTIIQPCVALNSRLILCLFMVYYFFCKQLWRPYFSGTMQRTGMHVNMSPPSSCDLFLDPQTAARPASAPLLPQLWLPGPAVWYSGHADFQSS